MDSQAVPLGAMKPGFTMGQAVAEANRCLLCHDAPCSKGCPGGTDPGAFVRKLRMSNVTGAIRTVKQNNILGGVCGALCPTSRLCEKECVAAGLGDRPVRIGEIQRFLAEHAREIGFFPVEKQPARPTRIAVVGSGPAGLACAAELARSGLQVTVFEAKPKPGGVLRYGVPSYRFSPDFLDREIEDVTRLGVVIKCNSPIRGRGAAEQLLQSGFQAVFLAPGLWEPLRLKATAPRGVLTSTEYLEGLRTERAADIGSLVRGCRVAVIGGGSVAIDCAESAVHLGARDVYLLYRRSFNEMPAEEDERVGALRLGVHLLPLNQPLDYRADAQGRLCAVQLARTELGECDASGRRKPVVVPGSEWSLQAELAIEAIGARAVRGSAEWYPSVRTTDGELVVADPQTGETSLERIYAGGDIVRGPALIIEAVKDGKAAAQSIVKRLAKQE